MVLASLTLAFLQSGMLPAALTLLMVLVTTMEAPFYQQTLTSSFLVSDVFSFLLSFMCIGITFCMVSCSNKFYSKTNNSGYNFLMISLMSILVIVFYLNSMFWFYIFFEISLFPILVMILGWGYQPERLMAGLSLMVYTIMASLPLIFLILQFLSHSIPSISFLSTNFTHSSVSNFLSVILFLGFLVKFPLFGFHLWLPKAHVEAPVAGSMILAALLLKLGGLGMARLSLLFGWGKLNNWLTMFALMGATVVSLICLSQKDMKILIAYSSVAHMGMVIAAFLSMNQMALTGGLVIMVAHGFSSSAMFMLANTMYSKSHTRNLVMSKSLLSTLPALSLFWFLVCLCNMAGPPSVNLLGEIFSIVGLLSFSTLITLPLFSLTFLAAAFTLVLFSSSQQGQSSQIVMSVNPMPQEELSNSLIHLFFSFSLTLVLLIFVCYI